MKTARRLMQQALRINRKSRFVLATRVCFAANFPHSWCGIQIACAAVSKPLIVCLPRKLFLEYFRLECLFIGHLAERREVLGLQQIGDEPTESSETSITLPKAGKGKKKAPEVDAIVVATDAAVNSNKDSVEKNDARKGFFEGNVPLVVYTLAVQAMESKHKSSERSTLPFEYHLQYVDIVNDIVAAGYAKSLRVLEVWRCSLLFRASVSALALFYSHASSRVSSHCPLCAL